MVEKKGKIQNEKIKRSGKLKVLSFNSESATSWIRERQKM
jgi:hypothetical protein